MSDEDSLQDARLRLLSLLAKLSPKGQEEVFRLFSKRYSINDISHMSFGELRGMLSLIHVNQMEDAERAPRLPLIVLPPGYQLARFLSFLLTREGYKRYVEPVIADMQSEYIEALSQGRVWHARWIVFRGHLLVVPGWLYALVTGKLGELLRRGGSK
jgi:hypothetical protein